MKRAVRLIPFYAWILIAMALGACMGSALGPSAAPLGELGRLLIQLIKTFAVPLLFFAIIDAFLRTEVNLRSAGAMIGISAINATLALAIGLGISNLLQPGRSLLAAGTGILSAAPESSTSAPPQKLDFIATIAGYVPQNLVQPFAEGSLITIILIAILAGAALRAVKSRSEAEGDLASFRAVEDFLRAAFRATGIILNWIIRLVPLAVFGVVAKVVGAQGFAPFKGLGTYVGVALLGLLLQVGVVYQAWLVAFARIPLRRFWSGAKDAVVYALGSSSSLATLPVTLRCLERMKVSEQAARMAACVGTNLNNDGILLYEAMAVLFVAQAHGIELSLGQQIVAALSCLVAGVGIAGVPDAGLISLSIVLATVGLPLELLPLLLTVDWVLSRARATTNVISDLTLAVLLDRVEAGKPRASTS